MNARSKSAGSFLAPSHSRTLSRPLLPFDGPSRSSRGAELEHLVARTRRNDEHDERACPSARTSTSVVKALRALIDPKHSVVVLSPFCFFPSFRSPLSSCRPCFCDEARDRREGPAPPRRAVDKRLGSEPLFFGRSLLCANGGTTRKPRSPASRTKSDDATFKKQAEETSAFFARQLAG